MSKSKCEVCDNIGFRALYSELNDREYGVLGTFSVVACTKCGLMRLEPQPSLEELKEYYPPDYHGFHTSGNGFISLLYNLVNRLRFRTYKKLAGSDGAVLDIVCADASYFDQLKNYCPSMDLVGVEFKAEIAEKARSKGRNVITGTIDDICHSGRKFDLIIMNNLIEHVLEPELELRKAKKLLNKNGKIIIETPNTDSWDCYLAGRYWGGLHVPRHTYLFSMKNLALLADRVGMEVTGVNYLMNTDHWALSVQNWLQSSIAFRLVITKGRTWYYKYLLLAFIPLNLIQKILHATGSLSIVLKHRNIE